MIGSSSYVTSVKKGRAIGGCCSSSSTGGGVTSLNSLIGPITIVGTGDTTVTTLGSTITVNSSGGGGGPFLPLAGGTMTGISGAPISNVESINGPPIGDLLFKTVSGNIIIDTSGSGRVQIDSPVVIQPPTGYTYPESISGSLVNIGTQIKDWVNTTTDPSGAISELGLFINNIASANGVTYGMLMGDVTSTTSQAYGINCVNISGATSANGGLYSTITSLGNSTGLQISLVTGDNQADGIICDGITSLSGGANGIICGNITGAGNTFGGVYTNITSLIGGANGIICSNITSVSGEANGININSVTGLDAYGIQSGNVSGGNAATGLNVYSVQSGSADSIGVNIGTITTNGSASVYGLYMTNMNALSGGTANALFIDNVNGDNQAGGIICSNITSLSGQANGIICSNITSLSGQANGINIDSVTGYDAYGIQSGNVSGGNTATGLNIYNIQSDLSDSIGVSINTINSSTASVYGLYMTNMNALSGGTANALFIDNVNGDNQAGGIICSNITTLSGQANGINIDSVTGVTHTAGIKLNNITGATAYGININNINSTTSGSYGVYIGPNLSGPVGSNFGFYQEGNLSGTKIVNNMMNELRCGTAEDTTTGTSFRIYGNAFYSTQYTPGGGFAENGGNIVLLQNTGGTYNILLPSTNAQEGHQYTICMRNTSDVIFDGSGILVNGDTQWTCPGIPAGPPYNYRMLQAFYTIIDNPSGEWYIG